MDCSNSHLEEKRSHHSSEKTDRRRTVAVTIDDLPVHGTHNLEKRQEITEKLLAKIVEYGIPVVGFVTEGNLGKPTARPDQISLLEAWLRAGLELGNHTYSHLDFAKSSLEEFQEDILRGEQITRPLMEGFGMELRWFRHPFLSTSNDRKKRAALEKFLDKHGYTIAPMSIDNADWYFDQAYNKAYRTGKRELMLKIADSYCEYMKDVFNYVEQFSMSVLGYELPQILLLHANHINADYLDRIADLILERGYMFITLEEALRDQKYETRDGLAETYIIRDWLPRVWASLKGRQESYPLIPKWPKRPVLLERL